MFQTIILIYLFWVSSALVEGMKFSKRINQYNLIGFIDYHFLRLVQSLSVFCLLFYSVEIYDNIYLMLGNWIIANQIYESIMSKMIFGKFFICRDTDFKICNRTIKIYWIYSPITIIIGFFLLFI